MTGRMIGVDALIVPDGTVDQAVAVAVEAEKVGIRRVWVADSPPLGWIECYLALAECARATDRVLLGPGVVNPITRDVSVNAASIATIDQLSNGRAVFGIGAGYSGVLAAGLKQATVVEFRDHVLRLRDLLDKRGVSIPIFLAASGPKGLHLAGEIADGVIISVGTHPALISMAVERIEAGAAAAGRPRSDIEIVAISGLAISEDWEEVRRAAAPAAARRCIDVGKNPGALPEELAHLRSDAKRVSDIYDVNLHARSEQTDQNRAVSDGLVDAYALAGTPPVCEDRVVAMRDAGADTIGMYLVGAEPLAMMHRFVDEVLPAVSARLSAATGAA